MTNNPHTIPLLSDCQRYGPAPAGLIQLAHIEYARLNARQKENHNYAKVSALLSDYGS
jgi:hypothetical protein